MRIFSCFLSLLAALGFLSSSATAQVQIDVWYVDVVSGSDSNSGSESAPFKSISAAVSSAVSSSSRDIIRIAPGIYSETSSLESFGVLGYEIPRSTLLEFWDIGNDLPGAAPSPVVIETTSTASRAFRFNSTGPSGTSGCLFARTVNGQSLPAHLLEFRGFTDVAILIDRRTAASSAAVGDEFVGTGIDFFDCSSALEIDSEGVKKGFFVELRNCTINLPTALAVQNGVQGATQAIEARAHSAGALSLKLDRVNVLTSDRVHGSSLITVEALLHNDPQDVQPPIAVELQSCRVGTAIGATGVHVEGAGVEVYSRVKGAGTLTIRDSDFINCRGDGVLVGAQGGEKYQDDEYYLSSWTVDIRYSSFSTGGLNSISSSPILGGSNVEFSGSGIHCWVFEAGRIPKFYAFKTKATNSGRHGVFLDSTGQLDFPIGYPDVDIVGCLLAENGTAAQSNDEMGHGLNCSLSDDSIGLELASTLFRSNASSGIKVHLGTDQLSTPVPGSVLATNCIVTGNLGFIPLGQSAPMGAPIHLVSDDNNRSFDLQMSFLTVVDNPGSVYSLALQNTNNFEDEDTLEAGSVIENSIFRENGGGAGDTSFYPEPSLTNDLWTAMFAATHSCDLNAGPHSSYYTNVQGNFYLDPLLLQTTVQGVDVGETFPDSSSASPVIDAGRIPAVSGTVGIDIRGFSRPSDYPGLGGSLTHDVGAFELHHSAGE